MKQSSYHTRTKLLLSDLHILYDMSTDNMHITHSNKFIKTLLNRSDLYFPFSQHLLKQNILEFVYFYRYIDSSHNFPLFYIYIYICLCLKKDPNSLLDLRTKRFIVVGVHACLIYWGEGLKRCLLSPPSVTQPHYNMLSSCTESVPICKHARYNQSEATFQK